jgi:hypothetical protein
MQTEIKEINKLLRIVREHLTIKDSNVLMSSFNTSEEVINCIDEHIQKLSNSDISSLNDLIVLFLPTSDLQEIAISNGWGAEYLNIAEKFDGLIKLIKSNK